MTDWYKCAGLFSCVAILSFGAKSLAASEEAASDVLIENGVAKATIVIPANPGAVERWAANDLQYVLEKMSGAKLPIVEDSADIQGNRVLIGETRFTDAIIPREEREAMGKEGYVVRLRGRDLACAGGGPYGHMYAVDELYDRLGVRFYMPGPLGECIPKCDTVRFDEFEAKRWPSFAMRWISRDTQWNLRNRTNRMEDETLPPAFGVLPSLYHSQSKLLPQSQYLKTHPEYYAWDGKKRPAGGGNAKLCNSNPDVPKELAKNMAKIIRQNPGVDLIALSPTDGQDWCQCDECKALDDAAFVKEGETVPRDQTYSRRQMILYNRVAEELKKVFPNQTILAGAYNLYTWPPLDPSIHANRNLAIIVCHYQPGSACLMHPIEDPDCGPNARYLEILRAWQKQTPRIYFYEYYWKVNWLDLPWAIAHTVAADIKFYKANGFEGVSTQHSPHAVWGDFIPMYVAARMLWDDAVDAKALVDELYKNFYGEAAEPMRRFHEAIERQMAESKTHIEGAALNSADAVFTPDLLKEMREDCQAGQRLAKDDLVKQRLEKIGILVEYTEKLAEVIRLNNASKKAKGQERSDLLKQAFIQGDALRNDVLKRKSYYDGVVSGAYFGSTHYYGRAVSGWRKTLVDAGAIDPQEYPEKGAAKKGA